MLCWDYLAVSYMQNIGVFQQVAVARTPLPWSCRERRERSVYLERMVAGQGIPPSSEICVRMQLA